MSAPKLRRLQAIRVTLDEGATKSGAVLDADDCAHLVTVLDSFSTMLEATAQLCLTLAGIETDREDQ